MTRTTVSLVFLRIVTETDDDLPSRPSLHAANADEESGETEAPVTLRSLAKALPPMAKRKALGA